MLTMLTQESPRILTGYLFAFILALFLTGCGDGSDESGSVTTPSVNVVARTGPIVAVRVGETATLDGNKSTNPGTDPMSFRWSFSSKPDASTAILQNSTTSNPSFVADIRGTYMVQLVVSAGNLSSQRTIQLVVATVPPERDTGPVNHQGLSSNCVICHNGEIDLISRPGKIPGKSLNHLGSSNKCETCHTPVGYSIIPFVDHLEVYGNCSECHNGVLAIGKSEFHVSTVAECDDCHTTTHFLEISPDDGSFDHSNITRACVGCHNGTVAIGKTSTPPHPDTSAECGSCHTTLSFLGAFPDHTDPAVLAAGCDSCHGVGQVTGQPAGHPVTNVDCGVCHSIVTFSLGGVFNHRIVDPAVQPCESCHNDSNSINAPGKSSAVPAHPATSADCGNCHNTESFTGAFTDHTDPAVLAARCDSCHGVTALGMKLNHMGIEIPVGNILDCGDCHSPGTFATGSYDHAGVVSGCATCHNGDISVGKLINHIPTFPVDQDCSGCHNTTDFAQATFDHVGIDSTNCALCHDTGIATGKTADHPPTIPSNLDCSNCHTNFTLNNFDSFALTTFNHVGIDNTNCASCHDTGIATGKRINHIPAQDDCSICHNSTDVFTSTTFRTSLHQDINRGCEGCHNGRFSTATITVHGKPVSHLPTFQDCYICHTKTNFTFPITPFLHVGITGNCASCHDGSVNNVAAGAIGKTDTPIHQNTTGDCSVCHNTTIFTAAFVDHSDSNVVSNRCDSCHNGTDATGKATKINHVATNQDCAVCHVPGGSFAPAVFDHTGIVDNCASCHDGIAATGKDAKTNPAHIPTTRDCSICHTPTVFAGARFDHQGIVDNCASCHNGDTATGKANNHMPTNGDCIDCHQTTGFLPSTFEHIGIVDNCVSCHDGVFARGKIINHVATIQDCGACHTTRSFTGAVFDHTGVVDNCASCHDGGIAIGKDAKTNPAHIVTAQDCHLCHTTATFVGGSWSHDATSAGNCTSCHNDTGGGATFQPPGHLSTNLQCDVCHSTNGWAPTSFSHDTKGNYPGDHRVNPTCSACHGSVITTPFVYPSARYAPFCAACHERDFESEGDHIGGKGGTVEQNKDCGRSGCHSVTKSGF